MPRSSLVRPYMKLNSNEALELLGQATVWDDVRCPASSAGNGPTNPTFALFRNNGAGSVGVFAQRFANPGGGSDGQDLMFDVQWPHGIKLGTVAVPSLVYPHLHWSPNDAVVGNVGWGIEYTEANSGAAFPVTQFYREAFATAGVQYQHQLNGWIGSFASTTRNISGMLKARVFRTDVGGLDTYAAVVFLHEFDVHYEIDTIASRTPTVK